MPVLAPISTHGKPTSSWTLGLHSNNVSHTSSITDQHRNEDAGTANCKPDPPFPSAFYPAPNREITSNHQNTSLFSLSLISYHIHFFFVISSFLTLGVYQTFSIKKLYQVSSFQTKVSFCDKTNQGIFHWT